MKKYILALFIFFLTIGFVSAEELPDEVETDITNEIINVTLNKCVDAENFWVNSGTEIFKVKLLAYSMEDGNLNNDINNYVCNLLTNSNNIKLEFDVNSDRLDKYNRTLAWVYVDDELLQNKLIGLGYGQVNYVTGDYSYLSDLCETQRKSMIERLGIWNYPEIQEEYCQSNVDLTKDNQEEIEEIDIEKVYDTNSLYKMLFISSGILILLVLMVKRGFIGNGKSKR